VRKCTHQSPPGRCRQRCPHDNRCGACGKCKDKPPRGENLHSCRCGRFIDKSVRVCHRCLEFEDQAFSDAPRYEDRAVLREVIYQLNNRTY
jgi:hypothetical protein